MRRQERTRRVNDRGELVITITIPPEAQEDMGLARQAHAELVELRRRAAEVKRRRDIHVRAVLGAKVRSATVAAMLAMNPQTVYDIKRRKGESPS